MKPITTILLFFIFSKAFSQTYFESDSVKNVLFPDVISQIEDFPTDYDFQLRFWTHGGIAIPDQKLLILLTQKNGEWSGSFYEYIDHKRKKYISVNQQPSILNCDSTWNELKQNKILELPNMEYLRSKFYFITEQGDTAKIEIMDGLLYSFEFFTNSKYKRIEYHCPKAYYNKYTHIPELHYISTIIGILYRKVGIEWEPC
jgi:hypothetical protein